MVIVGCIGIAFFIAVSAFKRSRNTMIADGGFWSMIAIAGYLIHKHPTLAIYPLALLPIFMRLQLLWWFRKPITLPPITVSIALWIIMIIIVNLIPAVATFVIGMLVLFEITSTYSLAYKLLKQTSLSWFDPIKGNIAWMKWQITMSALLIISSFLIFLHPSFLSVPWYLIFIVVFNGLWHYSSTTGFEPFLQEKKYEQSKLASAAKYQILHQINHYLEKEKPYLDPSFSLKHISQEVKASAHQVSQVLNEQMGLSFNEMVIRKRISEAKKLLKSHSLTHLKIEEIGERVGYLSKSSFNTSFKKITGQTPSEFRESSVRVDQLERPHDVNTTTVTLQEATFDQVKNTIIMIGSYLKVYLRNLQKNGAFAAINLFGLVIGLSSAVLIGLYLHHELSYDTFHQNADRIHRIAYINDNPQTRTPHPMAQAMVEDFHQVEAAVSLSPIYGPGLSQQLIYLDNPKTDVMLREPNGFYADSTFFNVFDFELIAGNPESALKVVNGIVITSSLAKKLFKESDPMGELIHLPASSNHLRVTGVMKDPPINSHFRPNFIISYVTIKSHNPTSGWFSWYDPGHFNYIKLKQDVNAKDIEVQIVPWLTKTGFLNEAALQQFYDGDSQLILQPLLDIHLKSHLRWELTSNSSEINIYLLSGAILFLILIASINYINLSTARTIERTKEVGIRRTLGAANGQISMQFIIESVLTSIICGTVAWALSWLAFDQFKNLAGQELDQTVLLQAPIIISVLVLSMLIGILAGLYPAIFVNRIKPVEVLKGKITNIKSGSSLRFTLIGVQFIISVIMIFGSLVVINQIDFMETKSLGFNNESVLVMEVHDEREERSLEQIKNELKAISGVKAVAATSNFPGGQFNQNTIFVDGNDRGVACSEWSIDYDVLDVLYIDIILGRSFDANLSSDSTANRFIINETAYNQLQPFDIGREQVLWDSENGMIKGQVIGVMKDFHFKSLHEPIKPMIVSIGAYSNNYIMAKLDASDISGTIQEIQEVHGQFDQTFAFDHFFLLDYSKNLYDKERNIFDVFYVFTLIALLLAAIGLIGLVYLIISQRTREIGIRKIMGANLTQLLWLENRPFFWVTLFALIAGLPIGAWAMRLWLNGFAYATSISWSLWIFTSAITILITLLSVSFTVIRKLLVNPSKALRYE
ncbi:MAG: ABC transporter permease [Cyclobacteriaceae bacterium]